MSLNYEENIKHDFFNSIVIGNRQKSLEFAKKYLNKNASVFELYETVFKSSMYKIGKLWEQNKISVATEHLASAILESVMTEFYDKIQPTETSNKIALMACVPNEYHQIGIKMISDVFENCGWNPYFLGSNVPASELIRFAKTIQPDVFAISCSIYFNLSNLSQMISEIRSSFPDKKILIGGQAFAHGGQEFLEKFQNVKYLSDVFETEQYIKSLGK